MTNNDRSTGKSQGKDIIRTISAMHPHQLQCIRRTIVSFTIRDHSHGESQNESSYGLADGAMQLVDQGEMIILESVSKLEQMFF